VAFLNGVALMKRTVFNILGLILTWIAWLWLINQELSLTSAFVIAVAGVLAIIPVVLIGRRFLDRQTTIERADFVTTILHYLVAILFGFAVIAATKFGLSSPSWSIPVPSWLGLGLMAIGGLFLLIVVLNLAVKGLGAPFAVAMTRVVATDWMYAWTRNPMVLSGLAFLVGLGLWLQSTLFLVWLIIFVCPVFFLFLKVYEERELEIRFGESYLEYKARTPMLFPKKPEDKPNGGA
jgi:protein-S-isoprenylcysteine O-methyltransferase Ste14